MFLNEFPPTIWANYNRSSPCPTPEQSIIDGFITRFQTNIGPDNISLETIVSALWKEWEYQSISDDIKEFELRTSDNGTIDLSTQTLSSNLTQSDGLPGSPPSTASAICKNCQGHANKNCKANRCKSCCVRDRANCYVYSHTLGKLKANGGLRLVEPIDDAIKHQKFITIKYYKDTEPDKPQIVQAVEWATKPTSFRAVSKEQITKKIFCLSFNGIAIIQ